jgi:hypothetical protein
MPNAAVWSTSTNAGLIELPDLQQRAADVAARHRDLQVKRANLAEERATLARGNQLRRRVHDFAGWAA